MVVGLARRSPTLRQGNPFIVGLRLSIADYSKYFRGLGRVGASLQQ